MISEVNRYLCWFRTIVNELKTVFILFNFDCIVEQSGNGKRTGVIY